MDDSEFDRAMVAAAFAVIAERGWPRLTVAAAARHAGLPLDRARGRFPGPLAVLLRFGRLADQAALASATTDASVRDRLFDLIMRRIDVLQEHRAGVLALFRDLRCDPCTALTLGAASLRSMAWLLDAAGIASRGPRGQLRVRGLLAVWLWTVRAWQSDESTDLSATLAALDRALSRAEQAEDWFGGRAPSPKSPPPDDTNPPPSPQPEAPFAPDI